jgi:nucleoside-diphosphate-sugar epimerase
MQTILGATGVIGKELAKALPSYTEKIRLVSRNPKPVNAGDELVAADLLSAEQTDKAVKGSEVVYLTAGLQYDIKIWQQQWPVLMQNVLDACKKHNAKLVFFDNVYALGRVNGWMTEESPVKPVSKKGEVRAKIADMLLDEVAKGQLQGIIARAADFYGPDTPLSFINVMVAENFAKGKKAQWMISDRFRHSFTYTPDAGAATALLGNTESAYNQVWHLPADKNALTGKEIIELYAASFGVAPKYTVLSRMMLQLVGLFVPAIRESMEMLYQNDADYLFDSSKFDAAFNFPTTSYANGVAETARFYKGTLGAK